MHPLFQKADKISKEVIAGAIEVHKEKGPGLIESIYERCLLIEAKAVNQLLPIHKAQLLSYMKLLDVPIGLLINFHEMKLIDGLKRLILPQSNQ